MKVKQVLVAAAAVLVLAACGERAEPAPDATVEQVAVDPTPAGFAPELGVDLDSMSRTYNGIFYQDVQVGRGAVAEPGRHVTIEYRGWLPDGTLFEERPSPEGWGPSEFLLGASAPVPGLNDGIAGMRVGGVRRIVVPPEHGYGLVGRPEGVPAEATLVFEVRVTGVR